ncbi:MAG: DMT family transporter [Hyphomonadaceae bacterium]|nr:DMT family transporter [Hyphomonadaceae bacterium]
MGQLSIANLIILLAILAGALISAQGVVNGRLTTYLGGPLQAALISFTVGWVALLAMNIAFGNKLPSPDILGSAPWWIWLGGLVGAVAVTLAAFAIPRIGVAAYISALIAGQLAAALFYDHFGAFGQTVREITPLRLVGILLMGAGVYLIRRF